MKSIFIIRDFIRGEDEKHATDANTNGVVGHSGITTPIAPNANNMKPAPGTITFLKRKQIPLSHLTIRLIIDSIG